MTESMNRPEIIVNRKPEETEEQEKVDRSAEEMAEQASKTEHHYDRDHDIFTK
jgi:hypothetical protein